MDLHQKWSNQGTAKPVEPSIKSFPGRPPPGADWANAKGFYLVLTNEAPGAEKLADQRAPASILIYKKPGTARQRC